KNNEKELKLPLTKAVDFNNIIEVKSPMVGVFYTMSAPDKDPFVKIGSHVKKGDVLCIIEAMKLFNDIIAENDGEIVDICAVNGQVVEYSQVLFKIF
ncbi:MAG: accB, partial [Clostridia bacterium]|nr:accB [Clostridia bacterium]